ncbi:NAD(P)/FAD-dependent oxidoreductase [Mesorhizobium sp. B2-4-14]|uniref:NAD(P)/FAD-dependent oxidoreductase n=1 Tax=Mesorhizobium sp. B2-4-14 TaxID=2589935 RepID=UPI00112E06E4|nr:FAD-dependent oxidoreductase [Mesorhizobium sp. B2-4-14]TPK96491.1 NAD(P)/FAD-dependent oxidoreductase [Mesorhizobium sp. B2-4-14]
MADGTIIVGAGHAGVQLAASLRQEGYQGSITLFERETDLPYHKPPLSKAFLKSDAQKPQLLRGESFYEGNGIDLVQGIDVEAVDLEEQAVLLTNGTSRRFATLVLATGATPRMPDVAGVHFRNVVALRTMPDARRVHEAVGSAVNVVIIGGGFIGLEIGATLAALDKRVTIVEAADRLLGRAAPAEISRHVLRRLEAAGVRIILRCGVAAINGRDDQAVSVTTTADEKLAADLVIVGIGVVPNCLLATTAGLACENGILVDRSMRTSHENVFAVGDCARFHHWLAGRRVRLESVQNATDQAKLAARAIAGHDVTYRAVPWFWSDIGDVKLQMVGLSYDADLQIVTGSLEDNAFSIHHFSGSRLTSIDTVNRPAEHMLGRKMLAAGFSPQPADVEAGRTAEVFARFQSTEARPFIPAED